MCRYKFEFQYSHNRPYDLSYKKVVEEEGKDLDYIHRQVRDRKEADRALGHHARLKIFQKRIYYYDTNTLFSANFECSIAVKKSGLFSLGLLG